MKTKSLITAGLLLSITATAQDQAAALDSIYKEAELSAVVVKGTAPKTKLKGNSMLTKIEGSVLSQSGTLEEMLAKVPGMTKNGDDLEVIGKGQPVYYINGRKVQDINEFKTIRSEEILDVDVIHNPGAQYDATVTVSWCAYAPRNVREKASDSTLSPMATTMFRTEHSTLRQQ